MDQVIKTYADTGDISRLKYIFVDCLDVDPTFEEYREDYAYCSEHVDGLFVPYEELTPLMQDEKDWDGTYWGSLKTDLLKNFSSERFEHMIRVAQVVHAEKVKKLLEERESQDTDCMKAAEGQDGSLRGILQERKDTVSADTVPGTSQSSRKGSDAGIGPKTDPCGKTGVRENNRYGTENFHTERAVQDKYGSENFIIRAVHAVRQKKQDIGADASRSDGHHEIFASAKRSYQRSLSKNRLKVIDYMQDETGGWIEEGPRFYGLIRQEALIEHLKRQKRWRPCQGRAMAGGLSIYFLVGQDGKFLGYYHVEESVWTGKKDYFYSKDE